MYLYYRHNHYFWWISNYLMYFGDIVYVLGKKKRMKLNNVLNVTFYVKLFIIFALSEIGSWVNCEQQNQCL